VVEEMLSPYLGEQGIYILRPSTTQKHVAIALDVT